MTNRDNSDSTHRFSELVEDYLRSRPGYPAAIVQALEEDGYLVPGAVIGDIGSGTGFLSKPFLDAGYHVCGVEPNESMRCGAAEYLSEYPTFTNLDGSAEETGLAADSLDVVICGQAFHWFDPAASRREWLRISRPDAAWVVLWNLRRTDSTPFLLAYEAFLRKWGTDYADVSASWENPEALAKLFGRDDYIRRTFDNSQTFDFDGLKGRLLSSSYVPSPGDETFHPMLDALNTLFATHALDGVVQMDYDTVMLYERPRI